VATPAAHDKLTAQQREAVFRRGVSVVLSSGAGCGKTHVLTRRYLSHLEQDGAEVGQVVAITFTERAARAMRDRIRTAVLAHLDEAHDPEQVSRWEAHLRGLETAQISTIHAFCGNLLRQHAVEAGLDPRFDILQDYLAANLQRQALTDCLQGLLTADTPTGHDLRELVLLYGWKPVVEVVQRLATEEDGPPRQRWLGKPPVEIAREWLAYARAELLSRYVAYLAAACPKVARCLWLLRTTPCTGPKMAANVSRLLQDVPRLAEAPDLAAAVKEMTEAAKVGTERAKSWPSEAVYEVIKKAMEDFRGELPARLSLFTRTPEGLEAAVETGQRFARVAEEAVRAYRQLKRRNGVLDFQDLLVKARDLLRDHPDVRERLQRRILFLLIDELQDTDPVQMELVEHLAGAGLTQGTLFAVGDHSQSIYRFRRADVRIFRELKQRLPHEGRLGLTVNFRSQPALLDFVNILVGPGASVPRANVLEDYEPLQAHQAQVNSGPCVEFLWAPREAGDFATEARTREADWIARRVAAMVGSREALVVERAGKTATLRPVRAGDVVLLFRAMSNVELYETALRRYGLDYYLVGGRAFFAQQEIYDLLNLLRALENPQDSVSLVGTLRSPFCCLSDEALFVLTRHREGPWAGLHDEGTCARLPAEQRPRAYRARRFLGRWHALKDRVPIARLLGEVLADSGYDAATQFEFLGDRKLANLWKLIDMAREFDRSGLFGLAEFIARMGELVRTQPREEQAATQPENADVVRLMSIHQAKGLEFPVVVIPDLAAVGGGAQAPVAVWDLQLGCVARPPAEDPPPFSDLGWRFWEAAEAVEDWREDLRTLYVACTRAQDYLILSAALPPTFSPQTTWTLALAERFDLRTGRCLDEGIPAKPRPQVRVTDLTSPPPEIPPMPARRERACARPEEALANVLTRRAASLREEAPVCVLSMGELEALMEGAHPADRAIGWDAEDGSDRAAWERPRERVERVADPYQALRVRVIRSVLEKWDFREPEGWVNLLPAACDGLPGSGAVRFAREELEGGFRGFARSPVFHQLAEASACLRDLEYLLPLPRPDGLAAPSASFTVRGVLDCLWRDAEGNWHLLLHGIEAHAATGPGLQLRLALGALAVRQQFGRLPKTARCYGWSNGKAVSLHRGRVPREELLAWVKGALSGSPFIGCGQPRP
jgi:ATP-dependent helicase/nuclease subunit A